MEKQKVFTRNSPPMATDKVLYLVTEPEILKMMERVMVELQQTELLVVITFGAIYILSVSPDIVLMIIPEPEVSWALKSVVHTGAA
jgi:hypothetical protein